MTKAGRFVLLIALLTVLPVTGAAAKPVKVRSGTLTLAIDNPFGLKLLQAGVDAYTVGASKQNGVQFRFPVRTGRVYRSLKSAQVHFKGGLRQANVAVGVEFKLTRLVTIIKGHRVSLQAFSTINGSGTDTFEFAYGRVKTVHRTPGGVSFGAMTLKLSPIAAPALNSEFRTLAFSPGETMGKLSLQARA